MNPLCEAMCDHGKRAGKPCLEMAVGRALVGSALVPVCYAHQAALGNSKRRKRVELAR